MNSKERMLYHQIHPLKLAVDWGMAALALYFLWSHQLLVAIAVMFIPSIIASFAIIRWVNLEGYKNSVFGRYISTYMTHSVEGVRFLGLAVGSIGAWQHSSALIAVGVVIIVLAWMRGIISPRPIGETTAATRRK